MEYKALGQTGLRVSTLGFGASPLGNVFGNIEVVECQRAVDSAIDEGINFFDVSPYYGETLAELRLGEALRGKRQSVLVATKCGRYGSDRFDFSHSRILASIDDSLRRLQTDYVDLLQAHDIEFAEASQIVEETIPALQEIQTAGKARFLGLTGYQLRMLASLAASQPIDTVLSYCRSNLLVGDMASILVPVVNHRSIGLINASPLHMGLLGSGSPPVWHPASQQVKEVARQIVALCAAEGFDSAQVALRYCLNQPYAATTLIGMGTPEQVRANVQALDNDLDPHLLSKIAALVAPVKNAVWASGLPDNADYSVTVSK